MAWDDPRVLALISAAGGFLDPNGGPAAAMHLGMQGLAAGNQMQQQRAQADLLKNKLAKQSQIQDALKQYSQQFGGDTVGMARALISSEHPELIKLGIDMSKAKSVKSFFRGQGADGLPTMYAGYNTGEVSPTGVAPSDKLMQVNEGNQISGRNPYTFAPVGSAVLINMSQGESARLNQQERHFNANYGMAQQNSALERYKAMQPKLVDGAYMYPPSEQNPQGGMIKTPAYTAPKGSDAEKSRMSERVRNTLGDDTEDLIRKATGSGIGAVVDYGASVVGATTKGAEANATLKLRASTLAGNMPRFEGPQSDADRKYYLEMAGDLANPSKTTKEKLLALKELRRIHNLADTSGSVKSSVTPGASDSGWNVQRID